MVLFILAIVLGSGSQEVRYDLMEVNHVRDEFTQVIFYTWSPDYRRFDVRCWAMSSSIDMYPIKEGDDWVIRTLGGTYRSKMFRETHSQHDPERAQQKLYPVKERK